MKNVLAINCGSSSLKFGLYETGAEQTALVCEGEAEKIGRQGHSRFWFKGSAGSDKREEPIQVSDHAKALQRALQTLENQGFQKLDAAGHRMVHGGPALREHAKVTPKVIEQLKAAMIYAPLHVPPALAALEEMSRRFPELPQAVCLDTAFHRNMPDVSRFFALPRDLIARGVERYGFHGLSLESILKQMETVPERLVIAHLGNGCSVTAIRHGKSIDTTMGLTPTGGIMMGTRPGDLDPGVLLFLMRNGFGDPEQMEALVDHQSGLLGISQMTSDVRELLAKRDSDEGADLALRMFSYQVRKSIAAMSAGLGGLDMLVFSGGIGEHNQQLREEIGRELSFLGKFAVAVFPS